MIPLELKRDINGLLYTSDKNLLKRPPLLIDHRMANEDRYDQVGFYRFFSTDEYIIKYHYNRLSRELMEAEKEMLITLNNKQKDVPNVDFPIGYYRERKYNVGQIIKYYKDGISLDNICNDEDLLLLGKYYYHNEDDLHNLFLLFNDVLDLIYEMFENGIYYTDIHPGNIMLEHNNTKIIDFDANRISFNNKDEQLVNIMKNYCLFIKKVLNSFKLLEDYYDVYNDFDEAKVLTKKLENEIRRNR